MASLTSKQRRLVKELQHLYASLHLDFYNIRSYADAHRTVRLELIWRAVARQEVVTSYTHVDEYLASELSVYFFGTKRSFPSLWKTKRFQLFNAHFLEELSLMPKFRYVKSLRGIPKSISADIERLNALRNAMAHSFFPENVRKSRAQWKGKNIFTIEGMERFIADVRTVKQYFQSIRRNRY